MQLENNLVVEVNEHPNLYSMPTVPTAILCCAYDAENTYCNKKTVRSSTVADQPNGKRESLQPVVALRCQLSFYGKVDR